MTPGKPPRRCTSSRGVVGQMGLAVVFVIGVVTAAAGCGSTDERPATWPFISTAILEPSCATANCHSAIAQRAAVDLSDRTIGYQSLTARHFVITRASVTTPAGVQESDEARVLRSPVLNLMRAVGNLRMPPDMPLPEIDIQLVEKWILAGATAE